MRKTTSNRTPARIDTLTNREKLERKETLRQLLDEELRQIAGGTAAIYLYMQN